MSQAENQGVNQNWVGEAGDEPSGRPNQAENPDGGIPVDPLVNKIELVNQVMNQGEQHHQIVHQIKDGEPSGEPSGNQAVSEEMNQDGIGKPSDESRQTGWTLVEN